MKSKVKWEQEASHTVICVNEGRAERLGVATAVVVCTSARAMSTDKVQNWTTQTQTWDIRTDFRVRRCTK